MAHDMIIVHGIFINHDEARILDLLHSFSSTYNDNGSIRYNKFGNFRENFIFEKRVKRHVCDFEGMFFSKSVNVRVISPFRVFVYVLFMRPC